MNDDDYVAVLREELDEIAAELEEARAYREKRKRLIEVLKEERASLCKQKEERIKRSQLLSSVEMLEEKYALKKEERDVAFNELSVAIKSCNRFLIATGRPAMEEPIPGKALPMDLMKRKKNKGEEGSLSKSLTALSLVSPMVASNAIASQHTRISEGSMPSFHTKATDILSGSIHSATSSKSNFSKGSNIVVNGILKKRDVTPRGGNPKKPVAKLPRRRPAKQGAVKVRAATAEQEKNNPDTDAKKEKKPPKVDGDGDMTNFLDAIGYYSPEEGDEEKTEKS